MDDNLIITEQRPARADALKNRELLMQTAQRLFAQNGVDAVKMSDIAVAAGVGKGTLYRHFPNGKAELCQVLIDEDQRDLQERTFARLRQQGDPARDLEWFLGEVIGFVVRNQTLVFAEAAIGLMLDHPAHIWWRMTIRGLLARLKLSVDLDYVTDVLFVMLDPRTIHYQLNARGYTPERITDGLIDVFRRLSA